MRTRRPVGATTLGLLTIMSVQATAQEVPATPTFEAASIRPVVDQEVTPPVRIASNGWLRGRSHLRGLIHLAHGAKPYEEIVAAEDDESRYLEEWFEVTARPPEAPSPPGREDIMAMTRHLLAERFGLKVRVETALVRATVLRLIRPGALGRGLRAAPGGCTPLPANARLDAGEFTEAYERNCVLTQFGDRFRGTVTLDAFADLVSFHAQRPILNGTGLHGLFRIDVAVAPASFRPDVRRQSDAPALVDALRVQMGLSAREESGQPIRRFVVEHVGPLVPN